MRALRLTSKLPDAQADALAATYLDADAYDVLIQEDCDVYKPDGAPLIKFRKAILDPAVCAQAYTVLRTVEAPPTNRGVAAGVPNHKPMLKNGRQSRSHRISLHDYPELQGSSSGIIGAFDRYQRIPFCRLTAFNLDHPNLFLKVVPYIRSVDAVFRGTLPDRYEAQQAMVNKTKADWQIPGTAFTTITVNKNFRTAVHKDAGDLKEGFGVMSILQAGEYAGAYLVFPAYRVAVDMRTTDVCLADVHEWHGNTPIVGIPGRYERISCVFYYRANLYKCGTAAEELAQAKNRKPGDALYYDRPPADQA